MRSVCLPAEIGRDGPHLGSLRVRCLLLTVLFISLTFTRGYSQASRSPSIKADIQGLGNDTVFVLYRPLSDNRVLNRDTILAGNNSFTYRLPLDGPAAMILIPQKAFYRRKGGGLYAEPTKIMELFLLPNDRISIAGELKNNYLDYRAAGSEINKRLSQFRDTYRKPAIKAVRVELLIDSLRNIKGREDSVKALFKIRGKYFSDIMRAKIQFVDQHPDHDLSAYFVSRFSPKIFVSYYSKLTKNVREGMFHPVLKNSYQNYLNFMSVNKAEKELKKGVTAPDFSLRSSKGSRVSLSDYKGKIIVLDFWGTWCPPCMQELPRIKSLYEKDSARVKFIGIACHETEKDWRNAIKEHQLDWLQLLNIEKNDVSILYGIKGFPTKIIIGKDFKIIGRYIGLNEAFYKQLNELVR